MLIAIFVVLIFVLALIGIIAVAAAFFSGDSVESRIKYGLGGSAVLGVLFWIVKLMVTHIK